MLKKPEDKKQLGDFFGMSNSYAECYPATYVTKKGGWDDERRSWGGGVG